ncbi:MAG: hypothetical protein WAN36_07575 [Calditrichia bacterium]
MKKFMVVLLITVFCLSATQAFGQFARKNQVEVFAGASFPMSPDEFKDFYKMGLSLNAQYVIFVSPRIGIPIFAGYERFTVDNDAISDMYKDELVGMAFYDGNGNYWEVTDASVDTKGSASAFKFGAGIRPYLTPPEASTQIFLFGRASYNLLKVKQEFDGAEVTVEDMFGNQDMINISPSDLGGEADFSSDENKFGVGFGAGLEIPAGESFNMIFQGMYNIIFTDEDNTSFIGVTAGIVF